MKSGSRREAVADDGNQALDLLHQANSAQCEDADHDQEEHEVDEGDGHGPGHPQRPLQKACDGIEQVGKHEGHEQGRDDAAELDDQTDDDRSQGQRDDQFGRWTPGGRGVCGNLVHGRRPMPATL